MTTIRIARAIAAGLIVLVLPAVLFAGEAKIEKSPFEEERHDGKGAVTIGGRRIEYNVAAGTIMIEAKNHEPGALMSYVAYFKGPPSAKRPVTFFYNGGPGSATVWLHMGAFGPKRVLTGDGVRGEPAPYRVIENEYSPLDVTDLIFVDAPGTGFGRVGQDEKALPAEPDKAGKIRARDEELKKDFFGIDQDARAFDIFIGKFLSRFERWNSPRYLFGESYGTTRSAALALVLQEHSAIDLNGVMLLSQILNFGFSIDSAGANPGNDIPYELALPTYAATAWYHKRVPSPPKDFEAFLAEVKKFALTDYATALGAGDGLSAAERKAIAEKMHNYIGLPAAYIEKANLRIDGGMFAKTLLEDQGLTIGRLDSRFTGPSLDVLSKEADYDPQSAALSSAYVSVYNDYARRELGFSKDADYTPVMPLFDSWDFSHKVAGEESVARTPNVMPDLAAVMKVNPKLRVMLFSGYYDMATLFFAAEYEMNHLGLPPELHKNITIRDYKAGHMIYVNADALKDLHEQIAQFISAK